MVPLDGSASPTTLGFDFVTSIAGVAPDGSRPQDHPLASARRKDWLDPHDLVDVSFFRMSKEE